MIPRGEVSLIFAELGRVSGVFDNELYAGLIVVITLTTLVPPLALRWFYRYFGQALQAEDHAQAVAARHAAARTRQPSPLRRRQWQPGAGRRHLRGSCVISFPCSVYRHGKEMLHGEGRTGRAAGSHRPPEASGCIGG